MKQTLLCWLTFHHWTQWIERYTCIWEYGVQERIWRRCQHCNRTERYVPIIRHQPAHWTKADYNDE